MLTGQAGGGNDDSLEVDVDAPPRNRRADLPALRSPEVQAALNSKWEAAEAEERVLCARSEELSIEAQRLKSAKADVDSRLFYAERECRTATEAEAGFMRAVDQAEARRDALSERAPPRLVRFFKRRSAAARDAELSRLEMEVRQRCAAAEQAAQATAQKRTARAALIPESRQAAVLAKEAAAAATAAAEEAAAATQRADDAYSDAYAQERVKSAMADDALAVVASSAILVDAILPAAGEVLAAALGLERKDTPEERAARKAREQEELAARLAEEEAARLAAQQQEEAERILACGPYDHRAVLQVGADADGLELRQALGVCVAWLHPDRCSSPLAADALERCADAFAALGGGTWAAQEALQASAFELGLRWERRSYFEYIPPISGPSEGGEDARPLEPEAEQEAPALTGASAPAEQQSAPTDMGAVVEQSDDGEDPM